LLPAVGNLRAGEKSHETNCHDGLYDFSSIGLGCDPPVPHQLLTKSIIDFSPVLHSPPPPHRSTMASFATTGSSSFLSNTFQPDQFRMTSKMTSNANAKRRVNRGVDNIVYNVNQDSVREKDISVGEGPVWHLDCVSNAPKPMAGQVLVEREYFGGDELTWGNIGEGPFNAGSMAVEEAARSANERRIKEEKARDFQRKTKLRLKKATSSGEIVTKSEKQRRAALEKDSKYKAKMESFRTRGVGLTNFKESPERTKAPRRGARKQGAEEEADFEVSFSKIKVELPTVSSPILPVQPSAGAGAVQVVKIGGVGGTRPMPSPSVFVSPTGKARSALLAHKKK